MNPSNPSPGPRGPSVTDEVQALVQTYYSVFDAARGASFSVTSCSWK